jgi:dCTP deaminase
VEVLYTDYHILCKSFYQIFYTSAYARVYIITPMLILPSMLSLLLQQIMILSDRTIKEKIKNGNIKIEPFNIDDVQPASYDLHLGNSILIFDEQKHQVIDVKEPVMDKMKRIEVKDGDPYVVMPGSFLLANIKEITGVDNKHVGRLEGKSSLGRLGLIVHATAGFLDPGNELRMTLEIANLSPLPIKIYAGMKIAQMAFEELDKEVENPYGSKKLGSKYYGNMEVMPSSMYLNFQKTDFKKPKKPIQKR